MTLKYWLNAPAKTVSISLTYEEDDMNKVANYTGTTKEGLNEVTISTAGLPANTAISWSVTVNKTSPTEPKQISTSTYNYRFYNPQSVAVDKDPMSEYFGRILVTECLHSRTGTSGRNYVSSTSATGGTIKAGIYTLTPEFKLPSGQGGKGQPYTGGKTFTQKLGKFTSGYGEFEGGHQPYQVKISEDGRIFVSSGDLRADGTIIWELSKDLTTWTPIIRGYKAKDGEFGFNSNYKQVTQTDGKFYAWFNCSMDVKGKGDNLKLLLYSADKDGVKNHHSDNFRLDEYAIGSSTSRFDGTPTSIWAAGKYDFGVVYDNAKVIYDYEGGYWLGANRATAKENEPNLVHINSKGTRDQYSYSYDFFGGAGIMLHKPSHNSQTWMIKGLSKSTTANGRFGIWKITKDASGNTVRSRIYTVVSTGLGRNHNDFAIDYAENLYAVGNIGERIVAFALPYCGTKTTPARETFTLAPVDNSQTCMVTTSVTPDGYGVTSGAGLYLYGESVTVTATPSDPNRYEFVNWTKGGTEVSTNSSYTFTVTEEAVDLVAKFKVKKFTVEFFKLFKKTENYEGRYQDITDYYRGDAATMDKKYNTRLWRLFQVRYNNRFDPNHVDYKYTTTNNTNNLDKYSVIYFLHTATNNNDNMEDIRSNVEKFVDTKQTFEQAKNSFYWLGQYIEHIVGKEIDFWYGTFNGSKGWWHIWGYYLQAFFNRDKIYNADYKIQQSSLPNDYPVKSFAEYGKPDYWRKWWQQIDCELDTTWNYDKPMPTEWACRYFNETTYITVNGEALYPGKWHQWNDAAANPDKLLGWYYGEKNPDTWTDDVNSVEIVHNVNKSGNLIAIWVDKEIREDKNNYDVQMLMSKQGDTHDVKVYHPLQAGMYNTICLPFPLSTLEGTPYAGATVLRLVGSELENENVTEENLSDNNVLLQFKQVTFSDGDIMEAGVPYLIMPAADITGIVTFTGIDRNSVYTGEGKSIETDYITMHGCINPTLLEADNNTLILVSNNQLAVTSEQGEMLGLRAYFTLNGTAYAYGMSGQTVMQLQKQTPTAVEEIEDVIPETPVAKGKKVMYQGQFYILRDGKAYNMQGQLVGTSEEIIP